MNVSLNQLIDKIPSIENNGLRQNRSLLVKLFDTYYGNGSTNKSRVLHLHSPTQINLKDNINQIIASISNGIDSGEIIELYLNIPDNLRSSYYRNDKKRRKGKQTTKIVLEDDSLEKCDNNKNKNEFNDSPITVLQYPNTTHLNRTKVNGFFMVLSLLNTIENNLLSSDGNIIPLKYMTVRDIYYQNVKLYNKNQKNVNRWLDVIAYSLKLQNKYKLGIIASPKGLVYSPTWDLILHNNSNKTSTTISCGKTQLIPYCVIDDDIGISLRVDEKHYSKKLRGIVVFEKDAIFNYFVSNNCVANSNQEWIFITGKGYPDLATKKMVEKLYNYFSGGNNNGKIITINFFGDCDPYGINIIDKYLQLFPSISNTTVVEYKGVYLLEILNPRQSVSSYTGVFGTICDNGLNSANETISDFGGFQFMQLTSNDFQMGQRLLKKLVSRKDQHLNTKMIIELQRQLFFNVKGEMNVVENCNFQSYFYSKLLL
ncbi:uncharacterized protein SCODWIG_02885 [Saccharomycodes ludwigii]|uniref:DNA topoisomerase (ATP-hydrolyzing) n=1 Tax=Saccharomycodes ludwigii TaxID=36035 RepID=A0A376B9B9_9ASCO|nr:hypothetical protein SCDLUD_002488 [Saccharomycodes ludwigii]KAH3901021.1 hypothetical protein SCDLUD_002488 [Saccharomycodes ludwigii]SSD61124.1 uncharacterized protein SCODWIG_02885 [Saccharomycodes ludwigii]